SVLLLTPASSPFPYTTLFRSQLGLILPGGQAVQGLAAVAEAAVAGLGIGEDIAVGHGHRLAGGGVHDHARAQIADIPFGLPFQIDRKSTRLNSSHVSISYAVF